MIEEAIGRGISKEQPPQSVTAWRTESIAPGRDVHQAMVSGLSPESPAFLCGHGPCSRTVLLVACSFRTLMSNLAGDRLPRYRRLYYVQPRANCIDVSNGANRSCQIRMSCSS